MPANGSSVCVGRPGGDSLQPNFNQFKKRFLAFASFLLEQPPNELTLVEFSHNKKTGSRRNHRLIAR